MESIHRTKVSKLIESAKGGFISITFYKKDGSKRTINGRTGVKKYLSKNPEKKVWNREPTPYVVLYDVRKREYRHANINTAEKIVVNKTEYKVID